MEEINDGENERQDKENKDESAFPLKRKPPKKYQKYKQYETGKNI